MISLNFKPSEEKVEPDREGDYIYLGKWDFGDHIVGLLAMIGTGSGAIHRSFAPAKDAPKSCHSKVEDITYVVVGVDHSRWRYCLGILLHEIMELAFTEASCRFENAPRWSDSHANYTFMMTHEQFTEATERAALWLTFAQVEMAKAWKRLKYTK